MTSKTYFLLFFISWQQFKATPHSCSSAALHDEEQMRNTNIQTAQTYLHLSISKRGGTGWAGTRVASL